MNNTAKILLATIALAGSHQARGDDGAITGRYWFDNSTTHTEFTPGRLEIATDGLRDGLHTLNAYVEQGGKISSVTSRCFLKIAPVATVTPQIRLAVDGTPLQTVTTPGSNGVYSFELNTAGVREGLHQLQATADFGGTLSSTASQWFVKTFGVKPGEKYKTTVFLDGKPLQTYDTQASEGGVMSLSLDMNAVALGIHTLQAQVVSTSGVATDVKTAMFMRMPSTTQMSTMRGYYTIDSKLTGEIDATMSGNTFSFDFDASQLTPGLHSLSVYLASGLGLTTSVKTAWFIKIPLGGEGVKIYEYWINNNVASTRRVTLDKVANPFELISLVDIDEEPFRSTSFTFAIEEGKPVTYARNDFQVRFSDSEGRITMASKPYTDTRTRRVVTDIERITEKITTLRPNPAGANAIKWYQFEAEAGDSLALRFDRGAGYELYAPDATLLLQDSGADAVANRGVSLTQTGTHYIAVHDVANGGTPSMQFTHIPRFALLSNTPNRASESGFLVVDVAGNGFDRLSSIALEKAGQRIEPSEIQVLDRYNLVMYFNNEEQMPTGTYDLIATYNDEGEAVTATKPAAVDIVGKSKADVTVEVETPRIVQTPYEIHVNVTNRSDQQCWGVPVNLGFSSAKGFALQFKNFYPCDENEAGIASEQFVKSNLLGTGEEGAFVSIIIPYIGPNETISLTIGINSGAHQKVKAYAWNSEPWSDEFNEILADGFDFNLINNPASTGFITAKTLVYLDAYSKQYPDAEDTGDDVTSVPKVETDKELAGSIRNGHNYRIIAIIKKKKKKEQSEESSKSHAVDNSNGKYNPLNSYENTPKTPMPEAKSTTPEPVPASIINFFIEHTIITIPPKLVDCYQAGDPNDMHGYTAPSGDTHIGVGVKTVNYTIEFENDPEIANAPASVIKVDNTLDGKRLDLNTFKPLKMIIGDKETDLPAEHHFVKTLDMRPGISSVAELTFDYDATTGKAQWSIRSLDPMSMEPTKYMDDGVLPVNDENGRGTGYLVYSIDLLPELPDGTTIDNSATIVFDDNEPISTPVWTNTTDYVLPTSAITSKTTSDNLTFDFTVEGEDAGSGIWFYDLYMRPAGSKGWILVKSQIESTEFSFTSASPLEDADFIVLATDRAGNRQDSEILTAMIGDADGNGTVEANDVVAIRNYYLGESTAIRRVNADVSLDGKIDNQDATATRNLYLAEHIKNKIQKTRRK